MVKVRHCKWQCATFLLPKTAWKWKNLDPQRGRVLGAPSDPPEIVKVQLNFHLVFITYNFLVQWSYWSWFRMVYHYWSSELITSQLVPKPSLETRLGNEFTWNKRVFTIKPFVFNFIFRYFLCRTADLLCFVKGVSFFYHFGRVSYWKRYLQYINCDGSHNKLWPS